MTTTLVVPANREWRVIVIDNSSNERAEVRRLLLQASDRHYTFLEADSGNAGLRLVLDETTGPIACVILGDNLSDLDKLEVLFAVTGPDGLTFCPLVVLTEDHSYEFTRTLIRAGAQDCLIRGQMTGESLTRSIENAIERWTICNELLSQKSEHDDLAAIVACTDEAIVGKSLDGTITCWNKGAQKLFGYTAEEVIGKPGTLLVPENKIDEVQQSLARVRLGDTVHLETVRRAKDGTLLDALLTVSPVRSPLGKIVGAAKIARDISHQKRNEAIIRQQEAEFRSLFEAAGTGNVEVDLASKRFRRVNQKFCEIVGYAADELLSGMKIRDITHPDDSDWDSTPKIAYRDSRNEILEVEKRWVRKDGNVIWIHLTSSVIHDSTGLPMRLLGSVTDITTRKGSEEGLRRNAEQLKLALEASGAGMWWWEPNCGTSWDDQFHEMYAFPTDSPRSLDSWLGAIHQDDRARVQQRVREVLETPGDDDWEIEFRVLHPTGERWMCGLGQATRDSTGQLARMIGLNLDVTARKRTNEAMRESEERLRLAIEATATGLWTWEVESDAVTWSPECYQIHGLSEGMFDGTGAGFFCLVHPNDRSRVESVVRQAIDSRTLYECDFRIVRPDGTATWVANRGRCSYDAIGRPLRLLGTITDISDRKQSEEQLQRSNETFARLIENNPFGMYVVDADFRLRQISQGAHKVFAGIRPLIGRDFEEIIRVIWPEPFASEVLKRFHHTLDTGEAYVAPSTVECRADIGEVEAYDWRIDQVTLPDGRHGVVCYFYDLSERQRWEAVLQSKEQEIRSITDNTPDIVTRFDRHLRHVFVNPAFERATGRSVVEVLGRTIREVEMPTELCDKWDKAIREVFQNRALSSLDFAFERPDGRRYFTARLVPEIGRDGEVEFVLGVTQDVTEWKRKDDALRMADKRKDEFLATLAHELRNPLAPIRNGVSVLRMSRLPAEVGEVVGMMDRQLGHMVNLVDDLLDVSRVRTGKITLRSEPVIVQEALAAAIEACRPTIDEKSHKLDVDLPACPIIVTGDKTRLVQIAANLLTNAAKYSEPDSHIRLFATEEESQAVISVSDTGMGISPELLPTLWDLFTQVRDTLDKAQGGLGIGLSLVKRLVEMHGGSVAAASDGIGHGSTFIVRLPIASTSQSPTIVTPHRTESSSTRSAVRRVLVVDDNPDSAASLAMLLRIWGHTIDTAHNGPTALQRALEFKPDVVFLDIGLPGGMDGYDVARQIRTDPGLAKTVLVALTGWGSDDDKRNSKAAGFDFHLTKPVEVDAVETLLAHVSKLQRPVASD